MKTIVFSDTHLTHKFDPAKFNFLVKLINSADQIIINGDFWDSWFTDFDHFIASPWKQLFPSLLNKNTTYIYGNHDPEKKCDSRVEQFSLKQAVNYELSLGSLQITCCHGDALTKGKRPIFMEIYGNILNKTDSKAIGSYLRRTIHLGEQFGFKLFGAQRMLQSPAGYHLNRLMKRSPHNNHWLICGDTHCPEYDAAHNYINSGTINYGFASFVTIDNTGLTLHQDSYK